MPVIASPMPQPRKGFASPLPDSAVPGHRQALPGVRPRRSELSCDTCPPRTAARRRSIPSGPPRRLGVRAPPNPTVAGPKL